MRTFTEIVQPVIVGHNHLDLKAVLELLGPDVHADLAKLEPMRRAALVDRLVRNLRTLSVGHGPTLERDLLKATGAEPRGAYFWELTSATALVDLRTGLKYLATWLGYEWADLSRLQANVCGLARWIQSSGVGAVRAAVEPGRVRIELRFSVPGVDARTLSSSAYVVAVRDTTSDFQLRTDGGAVVLEFSLLQR